MSAPSSRPTGTPGTGTRTARSSHALAVDDLLDDRATSILVCCGSGGVGKTTTAAALAVRAAERGRRVVVLTIDPARRLAQSMGLESLDNTPRPVAGVDTSAGGSLDAMMLDMKRTFDEVVEAHATPDKAAQIMANPFYEAMSSSFAGTSEYMAMEKLGQLRATASVPGGDGSHPWDLVVVDTPPSRSALDFLDAPRRLGSFLDGRFIRLLMAPAKAGGRAYVRTFTSVVGGVTGIMTKLLGAQVLNDVQTFVAAMDTMFGGFRERAEATYSMLQDDGTAFLVVASPDPDALREASYFVERLGAEKMPLAGLVLNRVQTTPVPTLTAERATAGAEQLEEQLEDGGGHPVTAGLLRLHAHRMHRIAREQSVAGRFFAAHPGVPVAQVPVRPGDVHDLEGLRSVAADLASGV
ncbi:ArsA family ATPase [Thalassiella azotivora]